jgi:hypothetical protein
VGLLISPSSLQSSTPMPWTLVVSHGHISWVDQSLMLICITLKVLRFVCCNC